MKRFLLVVAIGIIIWCTGCASQMSQIQTSLTNFDDQNAQRTIAISTQILKHWDMNSAFWKIQVGGKIETDEYMRLKIAWIALDKLKMEIDGSIAMNEKQAGEVLSWYLKWVSAGGKALYDTVLPSVLKLATELGIKI